MLAGRCEICSARGVVPFNHKQKDMEDWLPCLFMFSGSFGLTSLRVGIKGLHVLLCVESFLLADILNHRGRVLGKTVGVTSSRPHFALGEVGYTVELFRYFACSGVKVSMCLPRKANLRTATSLSTVRGTSMSFSVSSDACSTRYLALSA